MKTHTDIINFIIDRYKFQSYLEIGVDYLQDNFNNIDVSIKQGIQNEYYMIPSPCILSDAFFNDKDFINDKYDVIFVKGLRTTDQCYKDICNSITQLNNNGYIIIHDCIPLDEFHTRDYYAYLVDAQDYIWNGTVYKAFIRLKNELINWSCFVINENMGCGILTKRKILTNIRTNVEIENLSWDDFDKNKNELLQIISYKEFEDIIKKDSI